MKIRQGVVIRPDNSRHKYRWSG